MAQEWFNGLNDQDRQRAIELAYDSMKLWERSERRKKSSAQLRIEGEQAVFELLQRYYMVENISARGHAGDFMVSHKGVTIMIEVKNYATAVPKTEIDKFYSDLAIYDAGIMVSVNTKFAGVATSIHHEMSAGKHVFLLSGCYEERLLACIEVLVCSITSCKGRNVDPVLSVINDLSIDIVQHNAANVKALAGFQAELARVSEMLRAYHTVV